MAKKKNKAKNKNSHSCCCSMPTNTNMKCDENYQPRNESVREMVERAKNNIYMNPEMGKRKVIIIGTGESYSLKDLDKILNN